MTFREKCQIKVNNKKATAIISIVLIICITIFIISVVYARKKAVYAVASNEQIEYADNLFDEKIDIMKILEENTSISYKEEYFEETIDLEYTTSYEDNPNLPKGMVQVLQEGRDGIQTVVHKKTYEGDNLISEEEASRKIIKASINKIVQVGTGKYRSNYKVKAR